jgi:AraC-like DNA-binding protein
VTYYLAIAFSKWIACRGAVRSPQVVRQSKRMSVDTSQSLSTASEELNWSVRQLFASPIARISLLRCAPHTLGRSCEKCAVDNQVVFVTRGGFVKHSGSASRVANSNRATFFRTAETYRTSHLDPHGDTCAVFSFSDAILADIPVAATAQQGAVDGLTCHGRVLRMIVALESRLLGQLATEEAALRILYAHVPNRIDEQRPGSAARAIVRDVEAQLTADPSRNWSLHALARQFRRTPFYLTRSFRALLGVPLHKYLTNLRLGAALGRLSEGEQDLAALAADLGFSSHAHFSTAFKKHLGESPSAYRAGMVKKLKASSPVHS